MSFGGHGDLPRTLRYLCTGIQPDGAVRPPHDYGLAIVLLGVADAVVPANQVQPLRDAILSFLEASRLDMVDKVEGRRGVRTREDARGLAGRAGAHLMGYVNARDVAQLGPVLLPHARASSAAIPRCRRRARRPPRAGSISCTAPTTTSSPRSSRRCWRSDLARRGVPVRAAADAAHHPRRSRSRIDRRGRLAVDTLLDEAAAMSKKVDSGGRRSRVDRSRRGAGRGQPSAAEDSVGRRRGLAAAVGGADRAGTRVGQRRRW